MNKLKNRVSINWRGVLTLLLGVAIFCPDQLLAGCVSCGSGGGSPGEIGSPRLNVSLGAAYGETAGNLYFSASVPAAVFFTPTALRYDSDRADVTLVTMTQVATNILGSHVETNAYAVTNLDCSTNFYVITDDTNWLASMTVNTNVLLRNTAYIEDEILTFSNYQGLVYLSYTNIGTNTTAIFARVLTNQTYDLAFNVVTNYDYQIVTNEVLRQVSAPQMLADIPPAPTANGYVINLYFPSQITGTNGSGLYLTNGTPPFITWTVTNVNPANFNQLQISETNRLYASLKQWNYAYSTNTGLWAAQSLGGIQKSITTTNLTTNQYQNVSTVQYAGGAVVEQVQSTYQIFDWGQGPVVAMVTNVMGSGTSAQVTTYTYWDPATFGAGTMALVNTVNHPDGSQEYYAGYTTNGLPTEVYSTYKDSSSGRHVINTYDPNDAGVASSGDDGSLHANTARRVVEYVDGTEVSRRYSVFPSMDVRLEIQCTTPGADWDDAANLVTTSRYYTNGPNQYELQAVLRPDGTMTTYDYVTNGLYQTNITVMGLPDSGLTHVVDGVSNQVVLNQWGYTVLSASWDVRSGLALARDSYGNFDSFGRPQQVTHLDGTTEYTQYACCGVESSQDRDGVTTVNLYDTDQRPNGYRKIYSSGTNNAITYQTVLDAAGRTTKTYRLGSDGSSIVTGQSQYDLAGELVKETNALSGITVYSRYNDVSTGGLIRKTVYPNSAATTNFYYADGSLKKMIGTAVHGVRYEYGAEDDVNGNRCTYTKEIKLNNDGTDSSEWTKTYSDMAGRSTETLYADYHYSQSFYNGKGQIWKQVDPDGVTTLYQYDDKGELAYTVIDMDRNGTVDFGGSDRVTWTTNDVVADHGTTVRRSRTYVWAQDGVDAATPLSLSEVSADGLQSWQVNYAAASSTLTNQSQTSYSSGSRSAINTIPDGSYSIATYAYGRLITSTRYDALGAPIGSTAYTYDAHGRQYQVTDTRNGTTTYGYNVADLVATVTTPHPGTLGGGPQVTTTYYNTMLQPTNVVQPDGTSVSTTYSPTGEILVQSGSRTYWSGYIYDYAGRMKAMVNWSDFANTTGRRETDWSYDSYRGWLTGKTYEGGVAGPSYTYTYAGRLASRTWARGITTSYAYDNAGGLTNVAYSDGVTPDVGYAYDRMGRQTSATWDGITDAKTYTLAGVLLSESFSGGLLDGLSVTNGYDQFLRRTKLATLFAGTSLQSVTYGYDDASRLSTVSDGANSATYSYVANSPLVSQIAFKQGSTTRMTTTKSYDHLNRLTAISSAASNTVAFNYTYNQANQRSRNTLADGSYWIYTYDTLGQVTSGIKYWADGTPVAGQQFGYSFDDIGNRTQTLSGGDETGGNRQLALYGANSLNQITNRDVPGAVDIMGLSFATNTVAVNGQTAYRKGEYFRKELAVNNSAKPLWTNIITTATGQTSVTGNVYVAQSPEVFLYDADGNLTNDGHWAYIWDAENRLVQMTVNTNVGPQYQLNFAYDPQSRRVSKMVATNGVSISTNKFMYDGWNLIAELNPASSLVRSYMWGTDLSGSMQGAGGVGGLLEVSYYGTSTTNCFPAYDGNGNVMALVNAADGTTLANYEYGAFGEPIRITGLMANNNPFRFSTKYQDDESDLLYYGYRYYKPSIGTWLSKDPLEEKGGVNLYEFVKSNPINQVDYLGFIKITPRASKDGWDVLFDFGGPGLVIQMGGGTVSASFHLSPSVSFGNGIFPGLSYIQGMQTVSIRPSLLSSMQCKPYAYTPINIPKPYYSIDQWYPLKVSQSIVGSMGLPSALEYSLRMTFTEHLVGPTIEGNGQIKLKQRMSAFCACWEVEETGSLSYFFVDMDPMHQPLVLMAFPATFVSTEAVLLGLTKAAL